jgi:drug/metabolite transporter (DMT)-like permease
MTGSGNRLTLAAFLAMVLLAGGNAVGIDVVADELEPFWAAGLRFTAAGLIFLVAMLALRVPMPRGRSLLGAVVYGVLGFFLAFAVAFWAIPQTGAGTGQTLIALVPLLTLILAAAQGLETLRLRPVIGAAIAVIGVGILAADRLHADVPPLALLAVVLTATCFAETGVLLKGTPRAHPVATNAIGMLVGGLLLGILSAAAGERWVMPAESDTWTAMLFLVVFGSVAVFWLYLFVLGRWTASEVSIEFLLIPIATVVYSAILTGEPMTPALLVGGAVILAGVYVGVYVRPGQADAASFPVPESDA